MSKKKKDKRNEKKKEELVKEISPPRPYFNSRVDGDGFITFPGASKKIKTTSISDIMPSWYDHRDP